MRRQIPLADQLYRHLFPHPSSADPKSFADFLTNHLVQEVREEVTQFYGHLSTTEARYPGLNYNHPGHRLRLSRFYHHRRLFKAFDELGLTDGEIQEFCRWEGTRWARERFEADEGEKVRDTLWDEVAPFVDQNEIREAQREEREKRRRSITRKTDISVVVEDAANVPTRRQAPPIHEEEDEDEEMSDADSEDAGTEDEEDEHEEAAAEAALAAQHLAELERRRDQSILQHRLRTGQPPRQVPLPDDELEQYYKEERERIQRQQQQQQSNRVNDLRIRHNRLNNSRSARGYNALPPSARPRTGRAAA